VPRLRVSARRRVVGGGARARHVAERAAAEVGPRELGADEPVGLVGGLAELVLLDEHAEDVAEALVERAGLAPVLETALELGHAVEELVPDDVERARETQEQRAVTVAEHMRFPSQEALS